MATPKKTAAKTPPKAQQAPAEAAPNLVEAAKAEAAAPMSTTAPLVKVVQWRGMDLRIPPSPEEWDLDVAEAYEDGRLVVAIRGILGPDQWAAMKDTLKPKMKDLNELAETIGKEYGFTSAGE